MPSLAVRRVPESTLVRTLTVALIAGLLGSLIAFPGTNVGAQTLSEVTTGGSGGLAPGRHEVTIAGYPAIIIVGANFDPSTPTYLAYRLHGDEGGYDFFTGEGSPLRQLIDDRGWVFVSPQAPPAAIDPSFFPWDGSGGGDVTTNQKANADQIAAVLEHMFARYNVYRYRLLGSGASGGSWFHDLVFFPTRGAEYPSYFALNCGAGGLTPGGFNYDAAAAVAASAAAPHSELSYQIGTADFLFPGAQTSSATYASLGFSVLTEFYADVEHCAFDLASQTAEYWAATADRLGSPPGGVRCAGRVVTVNLADGQVPTAGDDVILGTGGPDIIAAGEGNDVVCGGDGDDIIWGGPGNDVVEGGMGADRLRGGPGDDELEGGPGADDLNGGQGNDLVSAGDGSDVFVRGGTGDDFVWGGPGDDLLIAGNGGRDQVVGGDGNDKVTGGPRPDLLFGQAGNDELRGLGGADFLSGGDGDDNLFGGKQPDTLDGGTGTDSCNGGTTGGAAAESDTSTGCEGAVVNVP